MSNLKKLMAFYKRLLKDHLVIVQSAQTGLLMGSGDLIAQTIIEKKGIKHIEPLRTLQFFTLGTGLVGPTLTVWYKRLSKIFPDNGKSVALKKMAMDQLMFAPGFLLVFITAINTLQGQKWNYTKEQISTKYKDILLKNYMIWPAVQIINFNFVHMNHQVLVVQIVALFWNAYLSWKTQQEIKK